MANYFELLKLPESFDVDFAELEQRYFSMQMDFHPDKAINSKEKNHFSAMIAKINEAYENIKNDFTRSKALLQINGINLDDEKIKNSLDKSFLQRQLDEFEFLHNTSDSKDLSDMLIQKYLEKKDTIVLINSSFKIKDINKACSLTIVLRYIDNIINNIKTKLQSLKKT